jgi:tetratricopeptide (TPR) repeat protein
MSGKSYVVAGLTLLLGLAVGFLIASNIDRAELDRLKSENDSLRSAASAAEPARSALSDAEIDERLKEAETRRDDFQYQKNLGTALYRYAAMKQDADLLVRIKPVVDRAATLGPGDVDVLNTAGNLYFDLAYLNKDRAGYKTARDYYSKVLAKRPDDANVLTDVGLTYFLDDPPDYAQAAERLNKAVELNPQDLRAVQFAAQAEVKLGRPDAAAKHLEKLKAASPDDPSVAELSAAIETARAASNT